MCPHFKLWPPLASQFQKSYNRPDFIANLLPGVAVKEFWNSVNIDEAMSYFLHIVQYKLLK